jgi:hypothetical protein
MGSSHQPPSLLEKFSTKFFQNIDKDLKINDEQILKNREIIENYQCENKMFATYYNAHIKPRLPEFERQRIRTLEATKRQQTTLIPTISVLIIGSFVLGYLFKGAGSLAVLMLLTGIILPFTYGKDQKKYQTSVRRNIYPLIFKFFGKNFEFYYTNRGNQNLITYEALLQSKLLPIRHEKGTRNHVTGKYKNVALEILELPLEPTGNRHDTQYNEILKNQGKAINLETFYYGTFIQLDLGKNFEGNTLVLGKYQNLKSSFIKLLPYSYSDLENVQLEDPLFNERFIVLSQDQVEARYLLTPSFMERLLTLDELFGGNAIQCSINNNKFLIMITTKKSNFEIGSIHEPATFEHEINTILSEMNEIFQIIDVLKLNEKTGL